MPAPVRQERAQRVPRADLLPLTGIAPLELVLKGPHVAHVPQPVERADEPVEVRAERDVVEAARDVADALAARSLQAVAELVLREDEADEPAAGGDALHVARLEVVLERSDPVAGVR